MNLSTDLHERFEREYVRPKGGRTLIVGSRVYEGREDRRRLYPEAVGVDLSRGKGVDKIHNLEHGPGDLGTFAHVECCSVLEHSERPWALARGIESVLEKRGTLYVSVPLVWRYHGYPGDHWRFSRSGVRLLFPHIHWSYLVLASKGKLIDDDRIPKYDGDEDDVALSRTEVLGFGCKF